MMIGMGDRVKRDSTHKIYRVSKVTSEWILLEEEGGSSQILAGKNGLDLSYKKVRQQGLGEARVLTGMAGI